LLEIEKMDPNYLNIDYRKEITDFLYKLTLIIVSQEKPQKRKNLKEIIIKVTQSILAAYTKEFSQAEHKKFSETVSMLYS